MLCSSEIVFDQQEIAKIINERKRKSESILRVGEISDLVVGLEVLLAFSQLVDE